MTTQEDNHADLQTTERNEIDKLIESGMVFRTKKQSLLRFFGSPDRKFYLQQPFLGTLDYLSREWLNTDFNEDALNLDSINEAKRLAAHNSYRCARIIAIAYLNRWWKIKFLTPFCARYFLWHLTPEKLWQLTIMVNHISNLGDFINSIRYLSANRTTSPNRMEKAEVGKQE